jgi:hypothetical protein
MRMRFYLTDITMSKDPIEERDPVAIEDSCIDEVDRRLNPLGRFHRHSHMHAA